MDTVAPPIRVTVRLSGGGLHLAELAVLTDGLRLTLQRIARALAGRSGPGRSPAHLDRAVDLEVTGLDPGGGSLEVAAPDTQLALPLAGVGSGLACRSLELVGDALAALGQGATLPEAVAGPPAAALERMLARLSRHPRLVWEERRPNREPRVVSLSPETASEALRTPAPDPGGVVAVTLVGELYQVNLHTGVYTVEDEVRGSVACDLRPTGLDIEAIRRLLGRRVVASGLAGPEGGARLGRVRVTELGPALPAPISDLELNELRGGDDR